MGQETDRPAGHEAPTSDADSERKRECVGCREEIALRDPRCRFCGTYQGARRFAVVGLALAGAILTVFSLVFGIRQLVGTAGNALEQRTDVRTRVSAAERLLQAGEHASAWSLLEPMDASRNANVRQARLAVGRDWLLHAAVIEGRGTFRDITDRVTPVLAASAGRGTTREQAETRALLGYSQFLRSREEAVLADPAQVYREALELDPDCGLAHLLLGQHLAGWTGDFMAGLAHLRRAVELQRTGQLTDVPVRERQLQAILNHQGSNPYLPNPAYTEASVAFIRVLDEIREEEGRLPDPSVGLDRTRANRFWVEASRSYSRPPDDSMGEAIVQALPLDRHLALLRWLEEQNPNDTPDPWLSTWIAHLQELGGDTSGAIETYARHDELPARLGEVWDRAMLRLTGEPFRPLSVRDPWTQATRALATAPRESEEFKAALNHLYSYMEGHSLGDRHADPAALRAARAAFDNPLLLDSRDGQDRAEVRARVGLHLGSLLIAGQRPGEAVPVLRDLDAAREAGHPLRGEVLVTLASAYAQWSSTTSGAAADLDTAVARLREAVETEGYSDWARIRWFDDLLPLRGHPEYTALLARHGRTVRASFAGSDE
jgi:hypothetical protein